MSKLKVAIKTYGCKVNQYESQLLRENFEHSNYQLSCYEDSELLLVNTCCVTEKAESEARRFVKKGIRDGKKVWVTGCAVKKDSELLKVQGIKIFENKASLAGCLLAGKSNITRFHKHTRAFVKIEDGCENFCSYCIIPYVRGPVKSRSAEDIVREVQELSESGYKEIILTGVDLGAYGKDKNTGLIQLLDKISCIRGIERIRLSSVELFHINDKLVEYLAFSRLFCPHFHIPLQSGSDKVLGLMRRKYTLADYLNRVSLIRKKIDNVTFTTDAMVGFPGEGPEDFRLTCSGIKEAGFLKVHIFRYSKRKGTRAFSFKGHLQESVKKEREAELRYLAEMEGAKIKEGFINRQSDVLIEKRNAEGWQGYTLNYMPAIVDSPQEDLMNKIIKVKAEKVEGGKLFCVPVSEPGNCHPFACHDTWSNELLL